MSNSNKPKHQDKVEALELLTLGISVVVAILIGVAIGYGLKSLTGYNWTFWIGIFWGVGAAVLNIYRASKRAYKSIDSLKDRYKDIK